MQGCWNPFILKFQRLWGFQVYPTYNLDHHVTSVRQTQGTINMSRVARGWTMVRPGSCHPQDPHSRKGRENPWCEAASVRLTLKKTHTLQNRNIHDNAMFSWEGNLFQWASHRMIYMQKNSLLGKTNLFRFRPQCNMVLSEVVGEMC